MSSESALSSRRLRSAIDEDRRHLQKRHVPVITYRKTNAVPSPKLRKQRFSGGWKMVRSTCLEINPQLLPAVLRGPYASKSRPGCRGLHCHRRQEWRLCQTPRVHPWQDRRQPSVHVGTVESHTGFRDALLGLCGKPPVWKVRPQHNAALHTLTFGWILECFCSPCSVGKSFPQQ